MSVATQVAKEFVGKKTLFISDVRTAQWRHMDSAVGTHRISDKAACVSPKIAVLQHVLHV